MLSGLFISADAQSKTDFRAFTWGESLEQVQSEETAKFIIKDKDDMLEYKDELGGYDCDVIYTFNESDKLISGDYVFTKKYTNPQLYLQDYNSFKTLLTEKYGKAVSEKENWSKNSTPSDKSNFGQAIADGNLILNTQWVTNRSVVQISLNSGNKVPFLHIHYTTKSLDELQDKVALEKALPKL